MSIHLSLHPHSISPVSAQLPLADLLNVIVVKLQLGIPEWQPVAGLRGSWTSLAFNSTNLLWCHHWPWRNPPFCGWLPWLATSAVRWQSSLGSFACAWVEGAEMDNQSPGSQTWGFPSLQNRTTKHFFGRHRWGVDCPQVGPTSQGLGGQDIEWRLIHA